MELRDCYAEFGGDYKEVLSRLQREQTVQKFVLKFLDDKSFSSLETALQNRNYEEALRFVHTLKGICRNLSFTRLYESSSRMTEAFKAGDFENAAAGMPPLSADYDQNIRASQPKKPTRRAASDSRRRTAASQKRILRGF